MGNAAYDERRRLEAENALLHEQKFNARLKREAAADELLGLLQIAVKSFLTGRAAIVVKPRTDARGSYTEIMFDSFDVPR